MMPLLAVWTHISERRCFIAMLTPLIGIGHRAAQISTRQRCDSFNISSSRMKAAFSLSILRSRLRARSQVVEKVLVTLPEHNTFLKWRDIFLQL